MYSKRKKRMAKTNQIKEEIKMNKLKRNKDVWEEYESEYEQMISRLDKKMNEEDREVEKNMRRIEKFPRL
jgi:hypothetical protein